MTKVYVVIREWRHDYSRSNAGVFATEAAAEAYIDANKSTFRGFDFDVEEYEVQG